MTAKTETPEVLLNGIGTCARQIGWMLRELGRENAILKER